MTYKIYTKVKKLEQKTKTVSTVVDKEKEVTMVETVDLGWFVLFEGSQEWLHVGHEQPKDLEPNTEVRIFIVPKKKVAT